MFLRCAIAKTAHRTPSDRANSSHRQKLHHRTPLFPFATLLQRGYCHVI
ncbi:hypothetical protein CKA32_003572 [Geitlerinema sp. FC II]|nr:hypothetical protein CKA32_003572 [Geitlerinema sp. FC II]